MAFSHWKCAQDGSRKWLHVASCVPNQAFPAQCCRLTTSGSVLYVSYLDFNLNFDMDFDSDFDWHFDFDLILTLNLDADFDFNLDGVSDLELGLDVDLDFAFSLDVELN